MSDIEFAQSILDNFLESCDDQIGQISELTSSGSHEELARLAHRFKGTAATVAAVPLQNVLEQLEQAARQQLESCDINDSLNQLVDQAQNEIKRLREYTATTPMECP